MVHIDIISRKVLTEQLKELKEGGIITRTAFKELLQILNLMTLWSSKINREVCNVIIKLTNKIKILC